jgi:hypothetical protein
MLEKFHSLLEKLGTQSRLQFRVAVSIASLTAALSALRVAFNLGYNYGVFHSVDGVHVSCCVNFLESFLIPITIALILSVVGLWSRKGTGFLMSLVALIVIPIIYVSWYFGTRSIMRRAEISTFEKMPDQSQHLLTLAYATWWDVYVLLLVIVLIMWQLKAVVFLKPLRASMAR